MQCGAGQCSVAQLAEIGAALPDIKLDERLRRVAVNQVSLNTFIFRTFVLICVVLVLLRGADEREQRPGAGGDALPRQPDLGRQDGAGLHPEPRLQQVGGDCPAVICWISV